MSFIIRSIIGFVCALVIACIVDVRLGHSPSIYTVAGAAPSALFAPTLIPIASYKEQFRSRALTDSILRGEKVEFSSEKGGGEGVFWGVLLALAFYIPFFVLPKKVKTVREEPPSTE
jgi:hypothetical protein